jgi:outer membrane protein OmpA-like peptidoglycan-associated protein
MSCRVSIPQLSLVKNFIAISFCLLFSLVSYSQVTKGAIKAFERALKAYEMMDLSLTVYELDKALDKSPLFAEAYFLKSQVYRDLRKDSLAMVCLSKGLVIDDDRYNRGWLELAELCWGEGLYDEGWSAIVRFNETKAFIMLGQDSTLNQYYSWVTRGLEYSIEAVTKPDLGVNTIRLGVGVNSSMPEYYPSMTLDKQVIIMTRRTRGVVDEHDQEDFYLSRWSNKLNKWLSSEAIPGINTPFNEGAATISGDGLTIVFTACEALGVGYGPREGKGSCDLFESTYDVEIGAWTVGENLGAPNSGRWESQPTLSADGNFLVFARARHLRGMGSDLFSSYRSADGSWSEPERLLGGINTPFEEESPFLHPDGKTLYFSSNGHPGLGHLDMFVSNLQEDGSWSKAQNLGYPMNSHDDENSLIVQPDGRYAIFASDRGKADGDLDLWRVEIPYKIRPKAVGVLYGTVVDNKTGQMLEASVVLLDAITGSLVATVQSGSAKGFVLPLPAQGRFSFEVDKEGYLFQIVDFNMSGIENQNIEVRLNKIAVGVSVDLKTIRFETGSSDLAAGYQADLVRLVNWLEANAEANVEIIGHTDNVGSDATNLLLSSDRALSVLNFLIANKIDQERLSNLGLGSSMPLGSNETDEGRASNRRVEIRIK